ncbi:hypothetical protein ES703_125114 [subsurface metagenome]
MEQKTKGFLSSLTRIRTFTGLAGGVIGVLCLIYLKFLDPAIIESLGRDYSMDIIRTVIRVVFYLAIVAVVLSFISSLINKNPHKEIDEPDSSKQNPESLPKPADISSHDSSQQIVNLGKVDKQIIIQNINRDIVFSSADIKKSGDVLLFLNIKKEGDAFVSQLEVKSDKGKKTITEPITGHITTELLTLLARYSKCPRGQGHQRIPTITPSMTDVLLLEEQIGKALYTFFTGDIRHCFEQFFIHLLKNKLGTLTLILGSDSPHIINMPFEMMRWDKDNEPLALKKDSFLIVHTCEKHPQRGGRYFCLKYGRVIRIPLVILKIVK